MLRIPRFLQEPAPIRLTGKETVDGRCLQQWLASVAGQVQETARDLQIGPNNVTRTWLLTGYPEGTAYIGQLNRLLKFHISESDPQASKVQVRLTTCLVPAELPENLNTQWLRNRQAMLAEESATRGTPDASTIKGLKAYTDIYTAVHFREDSVLRMWIAITATAPDRKTLDRLEQKLHQTVKTMGMAVTGLYKEQVEGLMLSHVLGARQGELLKRWPGRYTYTEPVSYLYPFLHGTISDGHGCYTGHAIDDLGFQNTIYIDFKRERLMNLVIVGRAGEGKSVLIKALIVGLLLEGFKVFVYDANSEYRPLCDALGGLHVDLTTGSGHYFEPLVIHPKVGDPDFDAKRFSHTCQLFHCVIRGLVPDLTTEEKDVTEKLLMATWRAAGVDPDDPATWDKPASVHDWYKLLCQHGEGKKNTGVEPARSLQAKLWTYFEGSQRLFKKALAPNWSAASFLRIAITDVVSNNAVDERIASVMMLLANHQVWDAIVVNKLRGEQYAMVFMDEGQRVLRYPDMAKHMYQVGTDARKFNAGLALAANDINVFFDTLGGEGLWENTSMHCLFHMAESGASKAAQNAHVPPEVLTELRELAGTYAFMLARDLRRWTRVKLLLPPGELELYRTRGLKDEG